ncbi:MAG: hypothetical protein AB7G11_09700 [Phycisphaerales bacterium]
MTSPDLPKTEYKHNTDLEPAEEYLDAVPALRGVLRFEPLIAEFRRYDAAALSARDRLRGIGAASIVLAGASLVGMTLEIYLHALVECPWRLHAGVRVGIELAALAAVVLALGPWFGRARSGWLSARFLAELIRCWHFELLLDGETVSKASTSFAEFDDIRKQRWARLMQKRGAVEGTMSSFADGSEMEGAHPVTPYTDGAIAEAVFRTYADLRLGVQLSYFQFVRARYAARDEWSESVARWTLFSAVLLSAGQLVTMAIEAGGTVIPEWLEPTLPATALLLVVISALVRVYRQALAIAEHRARYDEHWIRLVGLKSRFEAARRASDKLETMHQVETLLIEELRQVLRVIHKTNYLV